MVLVPSQTYIATIRVMHQLATYRGPDAILFDNGSLQSPVNKDEGICKPESFQDITAGPCHLQENGEVEWILMQVTKEAQKQEETDQQ